MKRLKAQEQPELDLGASRAARDEGMERVLGNTPQWWEMNYERLMCERPGIGFAGEFIGEDFRVYAIPIIGHPHHWNSWGAKFGAAVKKGWVVKTGKGGRQMRTRRGHARENPTTYRWPGEEEIEFSEEIPVG